MKALIIQEPGSLEGLRMTEKTKPIPGKGEVRIKVLSAGLNPSDFQYAKFNKAEDEERVLGIDICGIVDSIGSEVTNLNKGDRVYYLRSIENLHGGFAEYAITPAHVVSVLPDNIPAHVAGVIPGAGFTAYQALFQKLRPISGRTILIHGGAGGVGSFAIQLAKYAGLSVVTSCLEKDMEYVRSLGADKAIDFQSEDVHAVTMEWTTQRGVDYVLSTVGPEVATKDIDVLAFGGEIVVTAGFPDFNRLRFYDKGLSLHEMATGAALTSGDKQAEENIAVIGKELATLVSKGIIAPPKMTLIGLEEVPSYLKMMEQGKITGKIVAMIDKSGVETV